MSSLRSIRRPLHQSPLRTACCLSFAARGSTALSGEAHCEQGVPRALLEKPATHGTDHFVEVDLGEDAFFDVIVDRSEGFEQARFADENWPDPHGALVAPPSTRDDLVGQQEWRLIRVDVGDGEIGEGQVFIDSGSPFAVREDGS